MQITLNNGTILEVLSINKGTKYFQGENRSFVEFQFSVSAFNSFDAFNETFSNTEAIKKITVSDENTTYILDNYSLKTFVQLYEEDVDGSLEKRYSAALAEKTYAEIERQSLIETVDLLVLESLGV